MTTISVPWAAWHGDCQIELTFPPLWDVIEAQMQDAPALDDEAIRERLCTPIGTPPLRVLAQGRSSVIIVIDDTSRPTPVHRLMPQVLAELEAGGMRKDQICILIGSASHRPTTRLDSIKKLGQDIVETIEVRNHNPYENLANLGASSRGTPIFINNTFVQGDLKIAVGCIVPHEMAGFGGGAKVVGVGVAGVETLDYNHQQVASEGPVGLDLLKGNACREDIEEIALRAGLEMTIDVVLNSRRDVAGVFAGHPVQAHREGAEYARQVYTTPLPESVDVGVFNAYPKDTELLLGFNALNVGYGIGDRLIRPNGTVVVSMAASEGYGYHSQVERQGYVNSSEICWNRRLMVYSPNLGQWDLDRFGPASAILFRDWPTLVKRLKESYPNRARVAVFPYGTLQMASRE